MNTYFETPHITARGLRQAVYYKLGYTKPIMEIFPYWNGGDILWTEDLVNPDPRLDYLLDNPALGVSTIMAPKMFKRPDGVTDLLWNQHLFACTMTVYNLSALASGGNKMLLEMVMPICEKYVVREDVFKQYACKSCGGLVQLSKQKYEWYKWFI